MSKRGADRNFYRGGKRPKPLIGRGSLAIYSAASAAFLEPEKA